MDKKNYRPYMDICRATGKYEKDGKTRNRYHKIGNIISTPHHSNQFMVLDSLPVPGERLALFVSDKWKEPDESTEAVSDDPINLEDIPF